MEIRGRERVSRNDIVNFWLLFEDNAPHSLNEHADNGWFSWVCMNDELNVMIIYETDYDIYGMNLFMSYKQGRYVVDLWNWGEYRGTTAIMKDEKYSIKEFMRTIMYGQYINNTSAMKMAHAGFQINGALYYNDLTLLQNGKKCNCIDFILGLNESTPDNLRSIARK